MKNRTVVLNDSEAFAIGASYTIVIRNGQDTYASVVVKIPSYRSATAMSARRRRTSRGCSAGC